jgi:5-methyltetrahydrofolate--homocysteine methyltransferase
MSDNPFLQLLSERPYLIADGAMGTNLFKRGLVSGDAPELWNVDHPERIESVHQEFVDAGADIILTNSFGGNSFRLKLHDAQDRAYELAKAAAQIARKVADGAGRRVIVAGSMGPTGELFEPVGPVTFEDGKAAFAEQARGLVDGGADILWIETISSREESAAAVAGAAETGRPVVSTMTFDTVGRTMMGVTPEDAFRHLTDLPHPPVAIGANCGLGATENVLSVLGMRPALGPDGVLIAKANCGVPEFKDGEFRYTGTPELMADYARLARDSGARIIGGCCGTDGEVLKAIRDALDGYEPGEPPTMEAIVEKLGPLAGVTDRPSHAHAGGAGCAPDDGEEGGRAGRRRRRRG